MSQKAQNISKQGKSEPKRSGKTKSKKQTKRQKTRVSKVGGQFLRTTTVRRRELWTIIHFDINQQDTVEKVNFVDGSYPPWFDKIRKLYEMYQIHYLRIYTASGAATTTSGRYVLSYNTNEAQKTDIRSSAQLSAQQNAKQNNVFKNLSVVVPASSLKNFRTNTPTAGAGSWAFNVELGMSGNSVALDVPVWIEYKVTLRNPQI